MVKNRLKEIMKKEDKDKLIELLDLNKSSIIYQWANNQKGMSLKSAITIADYFKCSLDYLFYKTEDYSTVSKNSPPPFKIQLKKVLKENNSSQYKLITRHIVSAYTLHRIFNDNSNPNMDTVIKIADYLNISLDQLVGR